jgi:hypothetical protein
MAIDKGHRFGTFVMVGEVSPDNEYRSREDWAANRPVRQRVGEVTGKRQWKVMVTDPAETRAKRGSFEITLLADVQPVPTTSEALPGMRPIKLDGLTAEPRVAGQGEFKYQSYVFRATGFRQAVSKASRSGETAKAA